MAQPERDLPRVITGAMITVMTGFSLMNAAIYICLPFEVIRTSSTVAVVRMTLLPLLSLLPPPFRSDHAPSRAPSVSAHLGDRGGRLLARLLGMTQAPLPAGEELAKHEVPGAGVRRGRGCIFLHMATKDSKATC